MTWNQIKGHSNIKVFEKENKEINEQIKFHNSKIRDRDSGCPKLALETTKNKGRVRTMGVLRDGIHPTPDTALIWWRKMKAYV